MRFLIRVLETESTVSLMENKALLTSDSSTQIFFTLFHLSREFKTVSLSHSCFHQADVKSTQHVTLAYSGGRR